MNKRQANGLIEPASLHFDNEILIKKFMQFLSALDDFKTPTNRRYASHFNIKQNKSVVKFISVFFDEKYRYELTLDAVERNIKDNQE